MPKNKEDVKVSLILLKKLVDTLETTLSAADAIIAAGVAQESALLVSDMRQVIKLNTSPTSKDDDMLASLLDGLKGPGLPGTN